jgi:hypothetical protein
MNKKEWGQGIKRLCPFLFHCKSELTYQSDSSFSTKEQTNGYNSQPAKKAAKIRKLCTEKGARMLAAKAEAAQLPNWWNLFFASIFLKNRAFCCMMDRRRIVEKIIKLYGSCQMESFSGKNNM